MNEEKASFDCQVWDSVTHEWSRVFHKRMDCAEELARKIRGAVVTCLTTLSRRRWVGGEWHPVT